MPADETGLARPGPELPPAVAGLLSRLEAAGFEAWLVGGCVRDLLRGAPVRDFDVATDAPAERLLALFPRAIPIGIRHGTVMVPTEAGPVDVTRYRGADLDEDLAHRDFTVNAMAWHPRECRLRDPHGGARDLAGRRLRAVGSTAARMREDPLRALRAARLLAQLGFVLDPGVEPAVAASRAPLRRIPRERIRSELQALLLAPRAEAGLALLRRAGIEADLAPGTRPDAPRVVAALPLRLPLRLAGWLRGTDAEAILARLRFPRAVAREVGRLVRLHPVDGQADPDQRPSLRRLVKRAGREGVEDLFALRRAELAVQGPEAGDARQRLAALRDGLAALEAAGALALRRRDLALSGRQVMEILGCGPGPRVGLALDHLTECILEDPDCNTYEGLRRRLLAWAEGSVTGEPADA